MNNKFNTELIAEVFETNLKSVQTALNVIMKREDITVLTADVKRDFNTAIGYLLRIDIKVADKNGKRYNIEFGFTDEKVSPKIVRYGDTVLNAFGLCEDNCLEVYQIYVMEKDMFGNGLPIYHIESRVTNANANVTINNGVHIIFVNGELSDDKNALGRLVHDFKSRDIEDFEVLQVQVYLAKDSLRQVFFSARKQGLQNGGYVWYIAKSHGGFSGKTV